MEIEYNEELDEYFIIIPEKILNRLGWEDGDYIDELIEDDMLKLFKTED